MDESKPGQEEIVEQKQVIPTDSTENVNDEPKQDVVETETETENAPENTKEETVAETKVDHESAEPETQPSNESQNEEVKKSDWASQIDDNDKANEQPAKKQEADASDDEYEDIVEDDEVEQSNPPTEGADNKVGEKQESNETQTEKSRFFKYDCLALATRFN